MTWTAGEKEVRRPNTTRNVRRVNVVIGVSR